MSEAVAIVERSLADLRGIRTTLVEELRKTDTFHLRVVTHKENMGARRDAQTHCKNGHEFNELNTIWRKDRPGQRNCRQCARDIDKIRDAKRTRRRYKERSR